MHIEDSVPVRGEGTTNLSLVMNSVLGAAVAIPELLASPMLRTPPFCFSCPIHRIRFSAGCHVGVDSTSCLGSYSLLYLPEHYFVGANSAPANSGR